MTALCAAGGPSQAKAAFGLFQSVSPMALSATMNNWPTPWAVAAAAYLGTIAYDLSQFCATDPPATPTLTAGDYFDLITLANPVAHLLAVKKFEDWIGSRLWFDFCECVSGAQPSPPTAPTKPTGWPAANPLPGTSGVQICHVIPNSGPGNVMGFSPGNTFDRIFYGAEATSLRIVAEHTLVGGGVHPDAFVELYWRDAGGNILLIEHTLIPADGVDHVFDFNLPPSSADVICNVSYAVNSADTMNLYGYLYCGGVPGQTAGCCPPDPLISGQIDLILQMVTLLQRQVAPFAYVYGANHTALSGQGSISVTGLIGVSVDVTTTPAGTSSEDGVPVQYFDLGYVTLGTADGYSTSRRIDHDGTLFVPASAGLYTLIGYTLGAGVVADIRELVREP